MPSGSWKQRDVVCPFYIRDDGRSKITCEGFYDGCRTALTFGCKGDFNWHITTYCQSMKGYPYCGLYRAIRHKYEDPTD